MRHLDLFSGIGGFALAASWVWPGHEVVAFCEKEDFCRRILAKHWPGVPVAEDIRDMKGSDYANIDILTGGFPCQAFSVAGLRRGTADDRFLWPEMFRVIREAVPRYVVAENVPGLLSIDGGMVFKRVLSDMEDAGYEVAPLVIPACGVGAPHRRDRVWIVGYAAGSGWRFTRSTGKAICKSPPFQRPARSSCLDSTDRIAAHTEYKGLALRQGIGRGVRAQQPSLERTGISDGERLPASRMGRGAYGVSAWMDGSWERGIPRIASGIPDRANRLKALGNAIVPQVAAEIFRAIKHIDNGQDRKNHT